jgi:hypothetical protein
MSHVVLMALYAFLVGGFFALLWRRETRSQIRLFLQIFLIMLVGGIVFAWLMYPFPSGPPVPFP